MHIDVGCIYRRRWENGMVFCDSLTTLRQAALLMNTNLCNSDGAKPKRTRWLSLSDCLSVIKFLSKTRFRKMSPATTKKQSENSGSEKGRSKVRGDKSVKILHNLASLYKVQILA